MSALARLTLLHSLWNIYLHCLLYNFRAEIDRNANEISRCSRNVQNSNNYSSEALHLLHLLFNVFIANNFTETYQYTTNIVRKKLPFAVRGDWKWRGTSNHWLSASQTAWISAGAGSRRRIMRLAAMSKLVNEQWQDKRARTGVENFRTTEKSESIDLTAERRRVQFRLFPPFVVLQARTVDWTCKFRHYRNCTKRDINLIMTLS